MIFRSEVLWAEEGFCEDFDFGFEKIFLVWIVARKQNIQSRGYVCEWDGVEVIHAFV